ncbi:MAG: T9SS type A sorting domain-containing protein [Rhodothermaceae bacterium]|nr:T9SS type A sorting domain-containing protein [Rhodothermaceae bacterium]
MRLSVLLLLAALVGSAWPRSGVQAQATGEWELLPNSPARPGRHDDVFFVDDRNGWVVNGNGEVWRTLNGGSTWIQSLVLDPFLRSVSFATPQIGWVGALFGPVRLFETRDGAVTITDVSARIFPQIPGGICGLWAVNEQVVYGVGQFSEPAYVIKTTDGGQTWMSQDMSAYANTLIDVFFFDELRGFVVGGVGSFPDFIQPVVLMTEDGGATWSTRHTGTTVGGWGWKLSFPSADVGFISVEHHGNEGIVLKTTDGGLSWTELAFANGGSLQGLGFITPDLGWTSGRGVSSATADGGANWDQIGLDGIINRFRFLGDTLGFAVGERIYRYRAKPTATEPTAPPVTTTLGPGVPNPFDGTLIVSYDLGTEVRVRIAVYDVLGRRVASLLDLERPPGQYTAAWDGRLASGGFAPAGVYLIRLEAGSTVRTASVTLLR